MNINNEEYTILNNQELLNAELKMGIGFHNNNYLQLCQATAATIKFLPKVKTVLDYGAGTGVYAKAYYNLGFDVTAVEKFLPYRQYINKEAPELTKVWSLEELEKNGPIKVDVLSLINVLEHLSDEEIKHLFYIIKPKYILFCSPSEYSDINITYGTINVKAQTDYINIFKSLGFRMIANPIYPTEYTKLFVSQKYYATYR